MQSTSWIVVIARIALLMAGLSASVAHAADLNDLAAVRNLTSHRASSYDRTGGNVDSLMSIAPGSTHVLLETDGPGCVRHLWMTMSVFPGNKTFQRDLVLRMYWERSAVPSVEVPLGDFFALGHNRRYPVQSAPIAVGQHPCALNCYWPMPFYRHARIELVNTGTRSVRRFYYQIDYERGEIPRGQGLFHALFRRDRAVRGQGLAGNVTGAENYVVLDTIGEGQYVGCVLSVDGQLAERWYEGDDMIYIDGSPTPTIHGTGTEDYFGNAWGYKEAFCYPYYGAPLLERRLDGGIYATLYRFHIPDPIRFKRGIRVTFEHIFDRELINDYSSVAYWYQTEPVRQREPLPENNYPIIREPGVALDLDTAELEPVLLARGISARAMTTELDAGFTNGGYLEIDTKGKTVEIPLEVPGPGAYQITCKPVLRLIDGQIRVGVQGGPQRLVPRTPRDPAGKIEEKDVPYFKLGPVATKDGRIVLIVEGNKIIGLDQIRIYRSDAASQPASEPDDEAVPQPAPPIRPATPAKKPEEQATPEAGN